MQEMLYPTSYLESMKLDRVCALITDGRFSGGTSGLSIGHVSPEAASRGPIALLEDDDIISIDIPGRRVDVEILPDILESRQNRMQQNPETAWKPLARTRPVSAALTSYARFATSADKGAVRDVSL